MSTAGIQQRPPDNGVGMSVDGAPWPHSHSRLAVWGTLLAPGPRLVTHPPLSACLARRKQTRIGAVGLGRTALQGSNQLSSAGDCSGLDPPAPWSPFGLPEWHTEDQSPSPASWCLGSPELPWTNQRLGAPLPWEGSIPHLCKARPISTAWRYLAEGSLGGGRWVSSFLSYSSRNPRRHHRAKSKYHHRERSLITGGSEHPDPENAVQVMNRGLNLLPFKRQTSLKGSKSVSSNTEHLRFPISRGLSIY